LVLVRNGYQGTSEGQEMSLEIVGEQEPTSVLFEEVANRVHAVAYRHGKLKALSLRLNGDDKIQAQ